MSNSYTPLNSDYPVYLGVWTNWSLRRRVTGSVVTLNHRAGALLTAFLAVFVTFAGSKLWRIICFALHQFLLEDGAEDGLYHQRQAILRNSVDEKSGIVVLSRALWAWRQKAYRPLYRMLPVIILALLFAVLFTVSGIFSSRISSSMGNQVLLASPDCGILVSDPSQAPTPEQSEQIYQPWYTERLTFYSNYAQRCYSRSDNADTCAPFVKRNISSFINTNASCPFDSKICRKQDENIRLDTGFLNSQEDLGINGPANQRFNFRIVNDCAPLNSRKHQEIVYYAANKPYMRYFFGSQLNISTPGAHSTTVNHTYEVPIPSTEELDGWNQARSRPQFHLE